MLSLASPPPSKLFLASCPKRNLLSLCKVRVSKNLILLEDMGSRESTQLACIWGLPANTLLCKNQVVCLSAMKVDAHCI